MIKRELLIKIVYFHLLILFLKRVNVKFVLLRERMNYYLLLLDFFQT